MDKSLIHQGALISLYKERIDLGDKGHTYFDIVHHPGGAVIAAINEQNQICLLSQWRHAINETIWEAPAGCLEVGEPPLVTAQRELEEEAGVIAEEWQALGKIIPSPGFSNEILYLFKATVLSAGVVKLDDAEELEPHWIDLEEAFAMANRGEIEDSKTLAILLKLKLS
ncbi:MAG: NUDIX hydrolase [Pseudomonadota bacterium]